MLWVVHIDTDRTFRLEAGPRAVWDAFGRVEDYRRWWPWLRRFRADGLATGERWECTVRPPVPYELRFTIELTDVVAPERIVAAVSGDIVGEAELTVDGADDGTDVRLVSSLAPRRGTLQLVSTVAPRIAHHGHHWVLDNGVRQFRSRAL